MKKYMLDTNIVSALLKGHPAVAQHITAAPMSSLCISVMTEAELCFGLAKRPEAKRLQRAVQEFLKRVDVLPWNTDISQHYGIVRANMERQGKILAPLDLLIATHALSIGSILVTNDKAFFQVENLLIEDWTLTS